MADIINDQQQRQQALRPEQSFIVQAPAGSGKTDLLIKRFLLLLSTCQNPEEVLAITFTRKATLEMRTRIIEAITPKPTATEKTTEEEIQLQQLADKVIQQDKKLNWRLRENPKQLQILTIDSLCFNLVRSMPWSSRFGSTPTLLETQQTEQIYRQAALRTIRYIDNSRQQKTELFDQINPLLQLSAMNMAKAQSLLIGMLRKRDQWMRGLQPYTQEDYQAVWQDIIETEITHLLDSIPDALWNKLCSLLNYAKDNLPDTKNSHLAETWSYLTTNKKDAIGDVASIKGLCFLLSTDKGFRKRITKNEGFLTTDKAKKDAYFDVLEQLEAIPRLERKLTVIKQLPVAEITDEHWQLLSSIFQLLPLAVAELQLLFRDSNCCDYTEISQRAESALGLLGQASDLALLMDHKIQHILMDEVQDTSIAQIDLLTKLTEGWQNGDGRTLFFVGDPMQSIYRFRDADVGNFLRLQTQGLGQITLEKITLTSNFRSVDSIVDWCNQTFTHIFPKKSNHLSGEVVYSAATATKQSTESQTIHLHPYHADENISAFIVEKIKDITSKNPHYSIGILARGRSHLAPISNALANAQINHQSVELENLLQRPATQDLLSLTRALLDPNDRIAWLSILRAPWCGITLADLTRLCQQDANDIIWRQVQDETCLQNLSADGQKQLQKFANAISPAIQMRYTHHISERLVSAWLKLGGPACIPTQDLDDCESYFDMLEQMEKQKIHIDAQSLQQYAEHIWSERTSNSNIQLLTMHKSKGLQFDVVILPELHRTGRSDENQLIRWTRLIDSLLLAVLPYKSDDASKQQSKYDYLKYLNQQQNDNERTRLLYVACTRAKQQLHLLCGLKKDRDGEIKTPSERSLLGTLWPAIAKQITLTEQINNDTNANNISTLENDSRLLQRVPLNWQPNPLPTGITTHTTADDRIAGVDETIEFSWVGEALRVSGIAIHYLLEHYAAKNWQQWQTTNTESLVAIGQQVLLENGLSEPTTQQTAIEHIKDAIENVKQDPYAAWIFSNQHHDIHSEWALTAWLDGKPTNIKIDRSFVDENDTRWIIDFKSSRHQGTDTEQFLEQEKQRYLRQLTRYGDVVRLMEKREIKLALYFPLLQKQISWDYQ